MLDPAWVALSLVEHVGGKKLRALLHHFGDPRAILSAPPDELQRVPGIGPKIAAGIHATSFHHIETALPKWQAAGITILTLDDPAYPDRLRRLDDAPPTLFVRGLWRAYSHAVAIVGTRTPSPDSERLAQHIASELAERGVLIVSGMALGIDRAAHLGTLACRDGYTVAVLGSGVLNIYPQENAKLAQAILSRGGALVSELHPSARPTPSHLVARNRLISAFSDAVIIVETSVTGGAMHAARRAFEQGRAVYAVDNGASGNQALIEAGATPINAQTPDLKTLS